MVRDHGRVQLKATSIWSSCDDEKDMAFTRKSLGEDGNVRTSQLEYRTTSSAHVGIESERCQAVECMVSLHHTRYEKMMLKKYFFQRSG